MLFRSGLYCRIFTEGLFGIRPTGFRSFEMTPRLPKDWKYANLNKVRAFNSDFDIQVVRVKDKLDVRVYKGKELVYKKKIKEGESVRIVLSV